MSFPVRLACAAMLLLTPLAAAAQPAEPAPELLPPIACSASDQPIRTQGFLPIGGIDQWVTIRGAACGNPVILFIHGGPGNPMSPYSETIFAEWEKDFTIVQWDQRGAGRTYGRNPGSSDTSLSLERMTADGIELATYLAANLGQRRLVLVGTSWGSVLGVHMARARPALFHAYVGVSQLVSYRDNQEASYRNLLARARAAGDAQTVASIEALGPPPWTNPRNFGILRRAIRTYERRASDPAPQSWWVRSPLYATPAAAAADEAGEDYSYLQFVGLAGDGMLSRVDLPALGHGFEIPFYLVQGAEDLLTVPEVARRYFDAVSAPAKEYVLVGRAGHDPNLAMMSAVHDLLTKQAARWRGAAAR
ncbi:MAG TPA: alpha/beta hydrolase [Allosphingosinicella sp.]